MKSKFARTVRHVQIINSQCLMHYCTTLKGLYIGLIINVESCQNQQRWLIKMGDSQMDNKDVGILI